MNIFLEIGDLLRSIWICPCRLSITISYKEVAKRSGRPKAVRAAGSANAKNPLPIVIPCHRVLSTGGGIGGYGGGLKIKNYLLNLEGAF